MHASIVTMSVEYLQVYIIPLNHPSVTMSWKRCSLIYLVKHFIINIQKQISWEQVYRVNLTFNRKTTEIQDYRHS